MISLIQAELNIWRLLCLILIWYLLDSHFALSLESIQMQIFRISPFILQKFRKLSPRICPRGKSHRNKTIYICPHECVSLHSARHFLDSLQSVPHSCLWHLTTTVPDIDKVFTIFKSSLCMLSDQICTTILWAQICLSTWMWALWGRDFVLLTVVSSQPRRGPGIWKM
jgi:hypothetical protein